MFNMIFLLNLSLKTVLLIYNYQILNMFTMRIISLILRI